MFDCPHSSRHYMLLLVVVALAATAVPAPAYEPNAEKPEPPRYAPTADYDERDLLGWTIVVNRTFAEQRPDLCDETLTLLRHQLYQIVRVVPPGPLAKLQQIRIWVEEAEPHHPCMAYHPDANWLTEHDMNPDKARCVELANAQNFLRWTIDQPWMVIHELAHGYHHQFLEEGFANPPLAALHAKALESKSYDAVQRISGARERAYGLNDPMEYFAESSEAFFGTNDFYPFVRSELEHHDPAMFELLEELWSAKP